MTLFVERGQLCLQYRYQTIVFSELCLHIVTETLLNHADAGRSFSLSYETLNPTVQIAKLSESMYERLCWECYDILLNLGLGASTCT